MLRKLRPHLTYANVMVTLTAFVVFGGASAYASHELILSSDIVDGEVKTPDLGTDAVTQAKLRDGAVGRFELANGAVVREKINNGAVDGTKLANGAVDGTKVADGSLTGADIADDAIFHRHIGEGEISSDLINDGDVGNIDLGDGAVTEGKIAAGAVPRAYAYVNANGTLDPNRSKNVSVSRNDFSNPGNYCFDLNFTPKSVSATPEGFVGDAAFIVMAHVGTQFDCTNTTDADELDEASARTVRHTSVEGLGGFGAADEPFYIQFYD
jgi:hypothetical protein